MGIVESMTPAEMLVVGTIGAVALYGAVKSRTASPVGEDHALLEGTSPGACATPRRPGERAPADPPARARGLPGRGLAARGPDGARQERRRQVMRQVTCWAMKKIVIGETINQPR